MSGGYDLNSMSENTLKTLLAKIAYQHCSQKNADDILTLAVVQIHFDPSSQLIWKETSIT
jgi:hypothetical protein